MTQYVCATCDNCKRTDSHCRVFYDKFLDGNYRKYRLCPTCQLGRKIISHRVT